MSVSTSIERLLLVMEKLRNPNGGCPWDLEQTFATIAPHTIEETYELVEAIENGAPDAIKDELGDVLFQVVFYAQIAKESGLFDFDQVARHVAEKMIGRHPHVFGERIAKTAHDVLVNWETDKAVTRAKAAQEQTGQPSVLDGISTALPAATRAIKLQKRAARAGFDWAQARDVLAKIKEEIGELESEMKTHQTKDRLEDELGDVFFAITNLARKLDIDPETALRRTNRKFERRFRGIEQALAQRNKGLSDVSLDEMEQLWNRIKAQEE